MNLQARFVSREEWNEVAESAHKDLFGDMYREDFKNYDFTVLVSNEKDEKVCFVTIKEMDGETALLDFGGTFIKFRTRNLTDECLSKMSSLLLEKYKYLGFCCRTDNVAMIKVGLDCGYKIIGIQEVFGVPNLEFLLERGG